MGPIIVLMPTAVAETDTVKTNGYTNGPKPEVPNPSKRRTSISRRLVMLARRIGYPYSNKRNVSATAMLMPTSTRLLSPRCLILGRKNTLGALALRLGE